MVQDYQALSTTELARLYGWVLVCDDRATDGASSDRGETDRSFIEECIKLAEEKGL